MIRILELYAGIGGCAAAVRGRAEIVAAVDQDESAHRIYTASHPHPAHRWNLSGVRPEVLARLDADLWWMSPPCQPFTVRGRSLDVDDPRCKSFLNVIRLVGEVRPDRIGLENVPGFAGSRAHARLRHGLREAGYSVTEAEICPTLLGIPNRRRRFYLLARRNGPPPALALPDPPLAPRGLAERLDAVVDPSLYVPDALASRYDGALHVVDATDPEAVAHCFTAAYGRSPVHAGSYVRDAGGIRWFSAAEILRLLGFDPLPIGLEELSPRQRQKLVGNSLSVDVVGRILSGLL